MVSTIPARPPKVVWDLATPCRALRDEIGADTLRDLERPNRFLDWALLLHGPVAFVVLWRLLNRLPWGAAWLAAAAMQAIVIFNTLYVVRHDFLFHRRIAGKRASYALGVILSVVPLQAFAEHILHGDHHKHVGWDLSEEMAMDLTTRWKRWLSLTIVGMAALVSRRFRPADAPRPNDGFVGTPAWRRGLVLEKALRRTFLLGLLVSSFFWPTGGMRGYFLPVILFGPVVILTRFVFQHGETDPSNPFHIAVLMRTGPILRLLFLWGLGDCHAVHHFFPGIPMYRLGRGADLVAPILKRRGVPERTFVDVLNGFFLKGYGMRSLWRPVGQSEARSAAISTGG